MKATIQVSDKREAELIRNGLEDPTTRALVKVMGALSALPTQRAKQRTLQFVTDLLAERDETKQEPSQ